MNQNDYFKNLNTGLPQNIMYEKNMGNFDKAIYLIDERLKENGLSENLRESLLLQKEIISRLPMDYTYTIDKAVEEIKKLIPDFKRDELFKYIDERRFSTIYVNGEIMIFSRFLPVLMQHEDFTSRIKDHKPFNLKEWERCKRIEHIKDKGKLSYRIHIRHTLKIKDEAFKKGETYLVHLPLPLECDTQSNIQIEYAYPGNYAISPGDSLCRTIYWNIKMDKNEEFIVDYSYTSSYEYRKLNLTGIKCEEDIYEEEPHIIFSKYILDTANEITKGIDDPLAKAKAIYDYMTLNMKYSYQPSYFVMDNIPETCLKTMRGDCGIFALTFITLLRALGIPAHFESSKCINDGEVGSHDWARFYIKPYGWLYADVSYGIGSNRNHYEEGREYYFGNLDPYRMIANEAFQYDLPLKRYYRNDPYDNQSGEVEDSLRGYILDVDYISDATLVEMKEI